MILQQQNVNFRRQLSSMFFLGFNIDHPTLDSSYISRNEKSTESG